MKYSTLIFSLALFTGIAKGEEIQCLAEAMYFEARGEGVTGQEAVALVTLNRTKTPGFPKTVCGVVYQTGQYGWTRKKHSVKDKALFSRIKALAYRFYQKFHSGDVPQTLSGIKNSLYFTNGSFRGLKKTGRIGHHNFFRR